MCGGHHVAAGGGKLHEFGARTPGLEAGDVRGDVVNKLVQLIADCGAASLVRKSSGIRITFVKKCCAWNLRVKLQASL